MDRKGLRCGSSSLKSSPSPTCKGREADVISSRSHSQSPSPEGVLLFMHGLDNGDLRITIIALRKGSSISRVMAHNSITFPPLKWRCLKYRFIALSIE